MVWLPVKNRRFWSPQKRLEISRGESNCGRSPGSLPLECRTFSGTGVFTVWYREFYLKWKQTTFTLWRFQVLFIVCAPWQLVRFPFSLKASKTVMTIKQYYLFISVLTVSLFSGLTQQQHPSLLPMTQLLRGGGSRGVPTPDAIFGPCSMFLDLPCILSSPSWSK